MRRSTLAAALVLPLLLGLPLAGCGGDAASELPQDFKPLDFTYLNPLRLNVGSITVQDNTAGAADLGAQSPEPPDQALTTMANQRLIAAGGNATAVFTIERAAITADGDTLNGNLAVHLDIIGAGGAHVGVAQAQVSRQFSGTGQSKAALYALTKQMMTDMNVEFEYQVRRSLKDWLLTAAGTPVLGAVSTQALPPVGGAAVAAPGAPTPLAPAAAASPAATPAVTTSPPPGYLVAPAGVKPVTPRTTTGPIPPSTFDEPSNLPQTAPSTANPAPNSQPWGY